MPCLHAADGSSLRFKLPVLTFGNGVGADVPVAGEGIADLHCLVAPTPVGPAMRCFAPGGVAVNGVSLMAALLKDGDTLSIGDQTYTVDWEAVPAAPEPVAEPDNEALEQAKELFAELGRQRDEFRAEKAAARDRIAALEEKQRAAAEQNERVRIELTRELKEHRAAMQAEQQTLKDNYALLAASRAELESMQRQLAAEFEQSRRETEASNERNATAWGAVSAAREQLAAERQRWEAEQGSAVRLLNDRQAELDRREAAVMSKDTDAIQKLSGLQSEIAGLEHRVTHARMVLAELEQQRHQKATTTVKAVDESEWRVSLDPRHDTRTAEQLMVQLRQQEQEVARERQRLAVQLQNAATEKEHLDGQRALVVDQIRQLETARGLWQATQTQTLGELEQLARCLQTREAEIEAKEQALRVAEAERKVHAEQLEGLRKTLDNWQASLTDQETKTAAERGKVEAELTARRESLSKKEKDLGEFIMSWERRYSTAAKELAADRASVLEAKAAIDDILRQRTRDCDTALAEAKRLTAKSLAFQETKASFVEEHGAAARRAIRLARRRWEKRLDEMSTHTRQQRQSCDSAVQAAAKRLEAIHDAMTDRAVETEEQLKLDRDCDLSRLSDATILSMKTTRSLAEETEADVIALERAA